MTTIKLFVAVNMKGKPYVEHASGNRFMVIKWIAEHRTPPEHYRLLIVPVTFDERRKRRIR